MKAEGKNEDKRARREKRGVMKKKWGRVESVDGVYGDDRKRVKDKEYERWKGTKGIFL